jgi:hypothetical protein
MTWTTSVPSVRGKPTKLQERNYSLMAEEQSKFSGVLAKLKQAPTEHPAATIEVPMVRGRGRPPGKRSDPDYQPTTVLLRKQTKKTVTRLLEDRSAAQDLSELIEELLTEWIRHHS